MHSNKHLLKLKLLSFRPSSQRSETLKNRLFLIIGIFFRRYDQTTSDMDLWINLGVMYVATFLIFGPKRPENNEKCQK